MESQQRENLFRLQQEFNRVLLENPNRTTLQAAVLDALLGLPELDVGGIYERRPDGGYCLVVERGVSQEFIAIGRDIGPDDDRARLVNSGQHQCSCIACGSNCNNSELVRLPHIQAEGITTLVVLPVLVNGLVEGCINLASKQTGSITDAVFTYLCSIAQQFGRALEHLQAREEARLQRENLAGFFAAITDFVFVLDEQGRILYFNPAVRTRLGYDDHLLGQPVLAVYPPEFHAMATQIMGEMLAGQRQSCPIPLLCADGHTRIAVDTRIVRGTWNGRPAILGLSRDISELKAAQDELVWRNQLRELALAELKAERDLFIGGPVAVLIWRVTDNWPLEYASPNIANVFGRCQEAMLAADFRYADCVHPEDLPRVVAEVDAYLQDVDRKSWEQRYRIVLPDRQVRWIYDFTVAERDAQGQAQRLRGYVMDDTERLEAVCALQQAKEQLQFAIDGSGIGLWDCEVQTGRAHFNERWAEMIGYSLAELEPVSIETCTSITHPEDLQRSDAALQAHFLGKCERYICETRVRHKAGHWIWVLEQGKVVQWDGTDPATRKPVRMVGTNLDITERKAVEERLRLAASVFSHAHEAIVITDADGTIVDINDAFTSITGYAYAELIGKSPRIIKSDVQKREFYETFWRQLLEKGYWHGEIWNRRKSGETFPALLTVSTVHDDQGKVLRFVGLFSDITSAKEHEKRLEKIAHYDALTGLPNRILLGDRLHQGMAQTQRHGKFLALVYLDLDGFKAVNDNYGHAAGDHLLVVVSTRMRQTLRKGDTIARLGGDEFVAILLDLEDQSACLPMLGRLLNAASKPVIFDGTELNVSASVGVTFFPQSDDVVPEQLLHQADQAMYQAKLSGKNRYHILS